MTRITKLLPEIDVATSIVVLIGLLPLAGALPSIATPASPLADALWFTVMLSGAFLLLAAGPKLLLSSVPSPAYIALFASIVGLFGAIRLHSTRFDRLISGWLIMSVITAVILLLLRRSWIWGLVGGLWSGLLLGGWSAVGVYSYVTTPTRVFSRLLPVQLLGCFLAIVVAVWHFRIRRK